MYVFTVGGTTLSWISKLQRFFHFQQKKQCLLLLQRLVNKLFVYKGLWRNWERTRRIAGYNVIVKVSLILKRTKYSIQILRIYNSCTISYDLPWKVDI
jgi:hypothetical protein